MNPNLPCFGDEKNRRALYISACYNFSNLPWSRNRPREIFLFPSSILFQSKRNLFNVVSLSRASLRIVIEGKFLNFLLMIWPMCASYIGACSYTRIIIATPILSIFCNKIWNHVNHFAYKENRVLINKVVFFYKIKCIHYLRTRPCPTVFSIFKTPYPPSILCEWSLMMTKQKISFERTFSLDEIFRRVKVTHFWLSDENFAWRILSPNKQTKCPRFRDAMVISQNCAQLSIL